jgi:nucleoid DNA-binding protein
MDDDSTYRKAQEVVEAIFASIKASLLRKEDVAVEGFGSWVIKQREDRKRRGYRFGKVVTFKKHKAIFQMENDALLFAYDPAWVPHTSWAETENRSPKLSRKERAELGCKQEEERIRTLRLKYVRAIVRFFVGPLAGEDWNKVWVLRWNTSWYSNEADRHRPSPDNLRSIDDVENVINETKPVVLDQQWSNRVVDLLHWYARWTVQLDVDHERWKLAERDAREYLKRGSRWGQLYAGVGHL